MKLFLVFGHGVHDKDRCDEGMSLSSFREATIDEINDWNQVGYKGVRVSLERFDKTSKDYTRMQIRYFKYTEYIRWIELYVLAEDEYDAVEFVTDKFNKCWSRW